MENPQIFVWEPYGGCESGQNNYLTQIPVLVLDPNFTCNNKKFKQKQLDWYKTTFLKTFESINILQIVKCILFSRIYHLQNI